LAALLVDHLVLRNFGPYGIIFMNVRFVTTVAMAMLLQDFGAHGIKFINVCGYNCCHCNVVMAFWALWDNIYDCVFTTSDFPVILDGQFTHNVIINICNRTKTPS
jgi:hypothetical protein